MTTAVKSSPRSRRTVRRKKDGLAALPLSSDCDNIERVSGLFDRSNCAIEFLAAAAIMPRAFFQIDALDLAPRLLGKLLRRDEVVLQITEVEAYRPNDSACHSRFGITARTAPVISGMAVVWPRRTCICLSLLWSPHDAQHCCRQRRSGCCSVDTLLLSCLEIIQQRRGQKTDKPILLTGPGKVGQALGLSTSWSNHPLYTAGGLELLDGPKPENILAGPRIGIDYALPEHVNAPWRFAIAGSCWISASKSTLKPS